MRGAVAAKRVLKIAGKVLLGLLLLIIVPVLLVHAALLLPPVRDFVRDKATAAASEALHAKVQLDRLDALSIFGVRASGVRVLSLKDERLAALDQLKVDLNPLTLPFLRLSLVNVELTRPYVDLGAPADEGGGLLGLFKSDEPKVEEPKSEPSSFVIALGRLGITQGRVDVRASGIAYRIDKLDTELDARIGESIAAHVTRLRSQVLRDGEQVASIAGDDLGYGGDGASRARLQIHSGETTIAGNAQLGARDLGGAQSVRANLKVQKLAPETLANFGIDASTLTAPVDIELQANGTTQALDYAVSLLTPGGKLQIDGTLRGTELAATVHSDGIEPRRFLSAEVEPVALSLKVRANQDAQSETAKLDLELVHGTYGGGALPTLEAHARRTKDGDLWLDSLQARYPKGAELSAKGHKSESGAVALDADFAVSELSELPPIKALALAFAGGVQGQVHLKRAAAGAFTAHSKLQLTKARLDTVRVDALTLALDAHGAAIERPEVVVEMHAGQLDVAKTRLERVDLTVAGGPERYFIAGQFADRGSLRFEIGHQDQTVSATGRLSVAIGKQGARKPLRAEIGELTYASSGEIRARKVRLSYRDARASVDGSLDPKKRAELSARVDVPKLEEVTGLVMEQPVEGSIALSADVSGTTTQPKLRANAKYKVKALYGLKDLAVELDADADVPKRQVALDVKASSHAGEVEASLKSELRAARADAAAFMDGRHDAAVHFDRFKVSELSMWPRGTVVPIGAVLSGDVGASGRLKELALRTDLQSALKFGNDGGKLELTVKGSYEDEHLALNVDAKDKRGALLHTKLQTDLTRHRISRDPDFVKRVLKERSWEATVWLGSRRLDELPLLRALDIPEAALPAQFSASLNLKHMPGNEPEGNVVMRAAWDPPGHVNAKEVAPEKSNPTRCGMNNRPALDLEVKMVEGQLHSELTASLESKPAMVLRTESHAPIDEWFVPEPTRIRPAGVAITFKDLRLSRVPLACEFVDGTVSGHAELSRAMTEQVSSTVDLHASQIRWGVAPAFDANVSASANRQMLNVTTKLSAAKGSALIATNIPLEGRGRFPSVKMDAPAFGRVQIHNMDVRALLGPVPNVRASAGTLDTDLTLTGTITNPDVQGKIGVREVTVTLAELGQRVERVTGDLRLEHRTVFLERLKVHDRDGTAELTGQLTMREQGSFLGNIDAKADNFPVRKTGVLLARFNGTAALKADIDAKRTQFDLTMHRARIELTDEDMGGVQTLRTNPEIVFSDAGQHQVERVEERPSTPLVFNIDASEPFWVTRSDFSVLVSTKMKVEAVEGPVSVTGHVDIDRGYVELIGQSFDIERGHIEFTGGREVEPTLDLVANRRPPGGKKVTIKATGTLAHPELAFFVDDAAVTAGEALAAASGSRSSGSDSTVQQQVSSMATGLAAGVLTLGARRELGEWMPVLSIDAGENGPSVRAGIEADRFIPSFLRKVVVDAYVEGILSSGGDSTTRGQNDSGSTAMPAALLELRFPHDLVGEAQYGPGQRFSVDLGWEP